MLSDHRNFPIATHEGYNLIWRQAALIEAPDAVAAIMAEPAPPPHPGISPMRPLSRTTSDLVLFCGCDGRYFARFAPELANSAAATRPDLPLHIHVVCPTDDTASLAETLMASHDRLNVSCDPAPPWRHAEYFACDRFLVMPAIIAAYGAPVMALDADSVLKTDLRQVVEAACAFDFACFTTGRREPASAFQATLMYFAASPAALRFLDIVGRLVRRKLDLPPVLIWLLDQPSIFSAVHYLERYEPAVKVGDLRRLTGSGLRDHIAALGSEKEKRAMECRIASLRAIGACPLRMSSSRRAS